MFPSPHGDKFQPNISRKKVIIDEFPSPHGDKFQLNGLVVQLARHGVSVPSRG